MAEPEWFDKDFYAILGVASTATPEEVTRAYRRLAKALHPDSGSGDAERFKEIATAYEVIGDAAKRAEYDAVRASQAGWGTRASRSDDGAARGPWRRRSAGSVFDDGMSDVLSDFFAQTVRRRLDVTLGVVIDLDDADRGARFEVTGPQGPVGVNVPAGVTSGARLKVAGKGERGDDGSVGDLYLEISIAADPRFERDGDDLRVKVQVPYWTCVLGGEIEVASLRGPVRVKVKAGTKDGAVLRMRGKGAARLGGGHGDLLANVSIEVPTQLTEEQSRAVSALGEAFGEGVVERKPKAKKGQR
jgi:molecular chaperone DnaJ